MSNNHKNAFKFSIITLLALIVFGCNELSHEDMDSALNEKKTNVGYNLVLNQYNSPKDSLKKKAALFLLETSDYPKLSNTEKKAFYRNIDLAFDAWRLPWNKSLSFDQFKELLLPFDLELDTNGVFWRERFVKEYSFINDSLKVYSSQNQILTICNLINESMKKKYFIDLHSLVQPNTLNDWEVLKKGDCGSMAYLTNHIMRAVGIPVTIDFTPNWANASNSHFWNVALINNIYIPFIGTERTPGKLKVELITNVNAHLIRTKVFRKFQSINTASLSYIKGHENIPDIFDDTHIFDVSKEVIPVKDITLEVPEDIKSEFLYLSVFSIDDWKPVAWAKTNKKLVVFKDIRPESVYLLTSYENGKLVPYGGPFLINKDGDKHFLNPIENSYQKITCTRKYYHDDTNLIKKGDTYQLLYWGKEGWVELPSVVAKDKYVTFSKVPNNVLFLLKNLTRGKQERIFTYEQEKQLFW